LALLDPTQRHHRLGMLVQHVPMPAQRGVVQELGAFEDGQAV
jgi:hypothetical protein